MYKAMNDNIKSTLLTALMLMAGNNAVWAQVTSYILADRDTVTLAYNSNMTTLQVAANCDYQVACESDWLQVETEEGGMLSLLSATNSGDTQREAVIRLFAETEGVEQQVVVIQHKPYTIYQNNFDSGTSYAPFTAGWAWSPNYIKVTDQCLEFYYNQAALDNDNRRERRGAEITCDYRCPQSGWYGFRIFLPEGKFPKDIDNSIFCQLFNNGDRNSWAGHLSLNHNTVVASHRHALVDPKTGTVGTVEWNRWIPIVLYFKVGLNNKGRICVWMGDDMREESPAYDSGPVNFGFGDWVDDDTLNDVVSDANPKADYIGAKLGLYVSSGGDRTIRFDDIKLVEGNPAGAFNIVRPK